MGNLFCCFLSDTPTQNENKYKKNDTHKEEEVALKDVGVDLSHSLANLLGNDVKKLDSLLIKHKQLEDSHDSKGRHANEEAISQETDLIYHKLRKTVDYHANQRKKYYEEGDKAFDSGDKDKGYALKKKGKAEGVLMEQAQDKASNAMFMIKNARLPQGTYDLHGLQVAFAVEKTGVLINDNKNRGMKEIILITGAGNHSGKHKAKLRPAVLEYLNKHKYKHEDVNNGSVRVML